MSAFHPLRTEQVLGTRLPSGEATRPFSRTISCSASTDTRVSVSIERLEPADTRVFLEIHRASVREIAVRDYSPDVIEAWAPLPITDDAVEMASTNPDGEVRVKAVVGELMVGIGAVVPRLRELRACYVLSEKARMGVGRMIVAELETIARAEGAPFLIVQSS